MYNAITDIPGIKVGHYTDKQAITGCTVILCETGAVAGVDVRGSAPGTRETDLLRPMNLVEKVTAFKLQTRALRAAKMGDAAGASKQLRAAATRLLQVGEKKLAEAALEEAQNLEEKGEMSSAGSKKLRYATRKLTRKPRAAQEAAEGSDTETSEA